MARDPLDDAFAGWAHATNHRMSCLTFDVAGHASGTRVALGRDIEEIILGYGRPGVIRGYDHRGLAYQEVREFDFANWPEHMPRPVRKKLRRLVHRPEWVLISGNGMKAAHPTTGKWIRRPDPDFERLSRLTIVGEIGRP